MELLNKIKEKKAIIGIVGLGYVGLPLVIEFCKAGFNVIGFDVDSGKIALLAKGKSYIKHIDDARLVPCENRFSPTTDFSRLADTDCIVMCVPTPLSKHREPDMSYVFSSAETIAKYLRQGHLISLESTTYPGTTDEDMRTILEKTGLKAGKDFYLAFSPEREDPNNKDFSTSSIPKVVGGYTADCLVVAKALYDSIVQRTVPVSSTKVAEASKLLENIYRAVNIALVNELKVLFDRMGIDIWEVIDAAKTKPFGYQAFYPGPGLGGHCIPIDPFYLTWKAREYDFDTKFIELAGEINTNMPYFVVQKTIDSLNERSISINRAKVLILGVAYKKNVDDMRESPSLKLIDLYNKKGAQVDYNDPFIPEIVKSDHCTLSMQSVDINDEVIATYDVIVVSTDHSTYDFVNIRKKAKLIIDTRNAVAKDMNYPNVVKA